MLVFAHSYYSYRFGTLSIDQLIQCQEETHGTQWVLTDIQSTSGQLEYIRQTQSKGLSHHIGLDAKHNGEASFWLIALSQKGAFSINQWFSSHQHRKLSPLYPPQEAFDDVIVVYAWQALPERELKKHEYVGIQHFELEEASVKGRLKHPKALPIYDLIFTHKKEFNIHRILRAIDNNALLSQLPEEQWVNHSFLSLSEAQKKFNQFEFTKIPFDLCKLDRTDYKIGGEVSHINKQCFLDTPDKDWELINQLAYNGLKKRYPNQVTQEIRDRIENELSIIRQKDFVSYFLIAWDITRFAREKGYFYVGRGSGANSIIAYLLQITDVDPIDLDLYFERFINLFRSNPPDFDLDFSWRDRNSVTEYIFEKHGKDKTALLGAYVTFQYRGLVREIGKVFGLSKEELDALSKIRQTSIHHLDKSAQLVLLYAQAMKDFPNYLSVHSGGIIISEKPVYEYTATDYPPKGFETCYIDMVIAEDIGWYKFDILGQRGLGKIKDAVLYIEEEFGEIPFDIHDINMLKADPKIADMLAEGRAIGCFYVESPAMRTLLKKLQVRDYKSLVAASSVIRPGVSQSGMMRAYIERFRDETKRKEAHPIMLSIMPETFGVMVYQEDVIKVAHEFAGLTLAEADVLRRGMSGKYRSRAEFQKVQERYFESCRTLERGDDLALEIWRQIESFAGYSFSKGHSASYAVESYQSLYLKAHYPLHYMVAVLNNGGGFYSQELYLHEAAKNGAKLKKTCVNNSLNGYSLKGREIYFGFTKIHGFESDIGTSIVNERENHGKFLDLQDFIQRLNPPIESCLKLIRAGAFRFTGKSKRALLWEAHGLLGTYSASDQLSYRFETPASTFQLPDLNISALEEQFDELEIYGHTVAPPWDLLEPALKLSDLRAADLPELLGHVVTIHGYAITLKPTQTKTGESMFFGTFLDREGEWLDTVHFAYTAAKYPFRGYGIYAIKGKVIEEFGVYSIDVISMRKEAWQEDPRYQP